MTRAPPTPHPARRPCVLPMARAAKLALAPPPAPADGFPVLVASEESLADLNTRLQQPIPMDRFRWGRRQWPPPPLVLAPPPPGLVSQHANARARCSLAPPHRQTPAIGPRSDPNQGPGTCALIPANTPHPMPKKGPTSCCAARVLPGPTMVGAASASGVRAWRCPWSNPAAAAPCPAWTSQRAWRPARSQVGRACGPGSLRVGRPACFGARSRHSPGPDGARCHTPRTLCPKPIPPTALACNARLAGNNCPTPHPPQGQR